MALFGGANQTAFDLSGASLYGRQNELIAFKPEWLTDDPQDWWLGASSPDAFDATRSPGLLFFDRRAGLNSRGLLAWIADSPSGKTDLTYAAPANRAVNIVGLWKFNPLAGSVPFEVDASKSGLVTNLNADQVDGFDAVQSPGTAAPPANSIQVSRTSGRLTVGDAVDPYDAVNFKTLQAFSAGISTKLACQWATVSTLSVTASGGNTLTSTVNGEFNPDPDTRPGIGKPKVNDRVLVKNQWVTGNVDSIAIPNGIYYLFNTGSPTTPYVLKRTTDADQDGELSRGNMVFVENGTQNAGSQWQLIDTSPDGGGTTYGPAINPGVEPNWWALFFKGSAYQGGNGIVVQGLTIHFAQAEPYTIGSLFSAKTTTEVDEVLPPSAKRFLSHSGVTDTQPFWDTVDWADIPDKPPTFTPTAHQHLVSDVIGGNAWSIARFGASGTLDTGSANFKFDPAKGVVIGGATVTPGTQFFFTSAPAWTTGASVLAWSETTGEVTARPVSSLLEGTWPTQSGTLHRHVRWGSSVDRLTDALLIDDESGTPKITRPIVSGQNLGTAAIEFGTFYTSIANVGTLIAGVSTGTTPAVVLGVDSTSGRNEVKGYTSVLSAWVGLTQNAVGYGNSSGRLTGDPTKLYFDGAQLRILAGTAAAPALSFIADADTGFYSSGANEISVATQGSQVALFGTAFFRLVAGTAALPAYSFIGDPNTGFYATGTPDEIGIASNGTQVAGFVPGAFRTVAGTAAIPSHSFLNDPDTGLYNSGANELSVAVNAGQVAAFATSGIRLIAGTQAAPALSFLADTDTGIYQTAPGQMDVGVNGARVGTFAPGQLQLLNGTVALPALTFVDTDTGFYAAGSGQIDVTANAVRVATFSPVGLSVGMFSPTALLEVGAGTASKAPMRFAASGNVLVSSPIAGAVESDNNRLHFTNTIAGAAARHPIAHYDDLNFTNDATAIMAGAVRFSAPAAGKHWAESTITGGAIGTGDYSVFIRLRWNLAPSGINWGIYCFTISAGDSSAPYDFSAYNGQGNLVITQRDAAGVASTSAAIVMTRWAGRVIDLVVTRTAGVEAVYINGEKQTHTPGALAAQTFVGGATTFKVRVGNLHNGIIPTPDPIYRFVFFNRALSQADVSDLSRFQIHVADMWGSLTPSYVSDFSAGTHGWARGNSVGTLSAADGIGGKDDVLSYVAPSGAAGSYWITQGTLTRGKTSRLSLNYYLPATNAVVNQVTLQLYNTGTLAASGVAGTFGVWTPLTVEGRDIFGPGANTTFGVYAARNGSLTITPNGTDPFYIRDVLMTQVGAIVDLDFGEIIAGQVRDWSTRYNATLFGSFEVIRPRYTPVSVTDPGGGITTIGLRRYVKGVTASDDSTHTITHNFNLAGFGLMVAAWEDASGLGIVTGKKRIDANTVQITLNKIGAPSPATKALTVVITG
jgi:hypothetical protein